MAQNLSHQLRAAEDRIAQLGPRLRSTGREASALTSGSIESIPRLRIALSGEPKTTVEVPMAVGNQAHTLRA